MQVRRSSKCHVTETLATGARIPQCLASIYGSMWAQNIEEQEIFMEKSFQLGFLCFYMG